MLPTQHLPKSTVIDRLVNTAAFATKGLAVTDNPSTPMVDVIALATTPNCRHSINLEHYGRELVSDLLSKPNLVILVRTGNKTHVWRWNQMVGMFEYKPLTGVAELKRQEETIHG
jgi:hypothetical protein